MVRIHLEAHTPPAQPFSWVLQKTSPRSHVQDRSVERFTIEELFPPFLPAAGQAVQNMLYVAPEISGILQLVGKLTVEWSIELLQQIPSLRQHWLVSLLVVGCCHLFDFVHLEYAYFSNVQEFEHRLHTPKLST